MTTAETGVVRGYRVEWQKFRLLLGCRESVHCFVRAGGLKKVIEGMTNLVRLYAQSADILEDRRQVKKALKEGAWILCRYLSFDKDNRAAMFKRRIFELVECGIRRHPDADGDVACKLVSCLVVLCRRKEYCVLCSEFKGILVSSIRWISDGGLAEEKLRYFLELLKCAVLAGRGTCLDLLHANGALVLADCFDRREYRCRVVIAVILTVISNTVNSQLWIGQITESCLLKNLLSDLKMFVSCSYVITCQKQRSLWMVSERLLLSLIKYNEVCIEVSKHGAIDYIYHRCLSGVDNSRYIFALASFTRNGFTRAKLRRSTALTYLAEQFENCYSGKHNDKFLQAFVCFKYDEVGLDILLKRKMFREKLFECVRYYLTLNAGVVLNEVEMSDTTTSAEDGYSLCTDNDLHGSGISEWDGLSNATSTLSSTKCDSSANALASSLTLISCIACRDWLSCCLCTQDAWQTFLLLAVTTASSHRNLFSLLKQIVRNRSHVERLIANGICSLIVSYLVEPAHQFSRSTFLKCSGLELLNMMKQHDEETKYVTLTAWCMLRYGEKEKRFTAACSIAHLSLMVNDRRISDVIAVLCDHLTGDCTQVQHGFSALGTLYRRFGENAAVPVVAVRRCPVSQCIYPDTVQEQSRLEFCDSKSNRTIIADRQVLCSRSEFYHAMFAGGFAEANQSKFFLDDEDFSMNAFEALMHSLHGCMYCEHMECTSEDQCAEVLLLAITRFCDQLSTFLVSKVIDQWLDEYSVAVFLNIALSHNYQPLTEKCFQMLFDNHIDDVKVGMHLVSSVRQAGLMDELVAQLKLFFENRICESAKRPDHFTLLVSRRHTANGN